MTRCVPSFEKECPIHLVRAVVETGEAPEKLWGSMVALDWPALAVPEEFGGIGLTFLETAVVVEELGRAVAPGPLLATVTQFVPAGPRGRDAASSSSATSPVWPPAPSPGRLRWPTTRGPGRWTTSP